jgi:hypothetical protein
LWPNVFNLVNLVHSEPLKEPKFGSHSAAGAADAFAFHYTRAFGQASEAVGKTNRFRQYLKVFGSYVPPTDQCSLQESAFRLVV